MPPVLTRRARKRQDVSDRLYEVARTLFVEQGFDTTTMDEIAEHADVARATVFNHYKNKAAFLEEWGRRRRVRVAEALAGEHTENLPVAEQLRRYLGAMAKINVDSRRETAALMQAAMRFASPLRGPALDTELTELVRHGQDRGELRPDADPAVTGQLLAAGYFAAVLRWTDEPAPFDLVQRLDDLAGIVLIGLSPR